MGDSLYFENLEKKPTGEKSAFRRPPRNSSSTRGKGAILVQSYAKRTFPVGAESAEVIKTGPRSDSWSFRKGEGLDAKKERLLPLGSTGKGKGRGYGGERAQGRRALE